MTTSDMRYAIAIDTAAADVALQRVRNEVTTLAGEENALAKATDSATAALTKQGAAAAATSPKVETFQQRVAKLPDVLGKQAAAISLVSSSLEGMGGEVGKAVAGAGQIAAAFGAGGPFAAALVGGIAVIDKLTQYWRGLNEEEDRNIKLKFATVDAAKSKTEALKAELVELRKQADPEQARADSRKAIADELRTLEITRDQLRRRAEIKGTTQEQASLMRAESAQLDDQRKLLIEKLTLMAQIRDSQRSTTTSTRAATAQLAAPTSTTGDYSSLPGADPLTSMMMSAERQLTKVAEEEAAKRVAIRQAELDAISDDDLLAPARKIEDGDRTLTKIREELAEEQTKTQMQQAQQAATFVAGVSTQLVADLVSGQEQALERAGVAIMARAGQELIGFGVTAIGRGVLELSNPLTAPLAAGSFATGALLIGAGSGLGGVASGLGSLMGGEAGGSARGASPRTSTGSTGAAAGPTQITVVYAPSRDEGAAAVALAGKNAERRGLMNNRTR